MKRLALLLVALLSATLVAAALPELTVFNQGRSRLYLDVEAGFLVANQLEAPVADFERCFRAMTGQPLADTMKRVALFDPGGPGLRLQAALRSVEDRSANSQENGTVLLVLTPTQRLPGAPLAGPGEKVVWTCTWQRGSGPGKLQFSLMVANQPWQGPGYGPYTCVTREAPAPSWQTGQGVELALELRQAAGKDVRGGYRLDGGEWVYTDWFDPTKAGADTREPGVSDKNGPQAWKADWPVQWAGKTAAYVAGYGAKSRAVRIRLDDVTVTSGDRTLFSDGFAGAEGADPAGLAHWRQGPQQGRATLEQGAVAFAPDSDAWNTVGLVAASPPAAPPPGSVPLRLELLPVPSGHGRFEAQVVQGWKRTVTPQGLTLNAGSRLGLQNALYALLDQWGCRWVMPGDLGECLPRVSKLALPLGTLAPRVYNDTSVSPCGSSTAYADFYNRNQQGYQTWLTMQHYWLYALSPAKHFKDHPEWYSLINGRREPRQLCTTNPEVIAAMIAAAKAFLRVSPERVSFPMEPMDGIDFCQCPNCRALDPPGQYVDGAPCVTDRVLHFVNAVAAGIKEEFPDRYVGFYAYWTHVSVPVREKPAPNVVVGITRSGNCLLHLTPTAACPTSDFHALIRAWRKLTPNVYAYEYDPISWTGGLPCPTWLDMGRSLKTMFLDLGVKGSYSDYGVLPAAHAGTFLNRYLPLRMKLNPNQTPEAVLHDMCQTFFGPAARPLEQHYLEMAKVTSSKHPGLRSIGVGTTYYHLLFNPAQIRQARQYLDQGLRLAQGKSPYAERVAMVDLAQQYLEAYLGGVWAAQAKDYGKSVASFDRMDRTLAALGEKGWADKVDAPGRAKVMRLKTLAEHFPDKLGYVTDWKLLGPFDNSTLAAASEATPCPGAQEKWWAYRSPTGLLNLERAFAAKKGNWALSWGWAATTFHADREMPARLCMDSFFPYRVYLNGQEVFYRAGLNADCPDRAVVNVRLRPGLNTVIAKLCQTQLTTDSFPWGLYLRIVPDEAEDVVVLPGSWPFRKDPGDVGEKEQWFATGFDDSTWKPIRTTQAWEGDLGPYDGTGWYRVRFRVPAALPAGKLALVCGGCDEEAWVYLNGEYLGERTAQATGRTVGEIWEEPFSLPVPRERLRPGAENVLAIRVHDSAYAGGLYRGVRLVVKE